MIGVDEVEPDRLVAHEHLARPGLRHVDMLGLENLGATGLAEAEGIGVDHRGLRNSLGDVERAPTGSARTGGSEIPLRSA
jgi:hypothetical protein